MTTNDSILTPVRYLLIDDDGTASYGYQPFAGARLLLGDGPAVRVPLLHETHLVGYMGDNALDMSPRNVVASVVLMTLGASVQPYAGPVIIAGWNPHPVWIGRGDTDVRTLADEHLRILDKVVGEVRQVLGYDSPCTVAESVRRYSAITARAQWVTTAVMPDGCCDLDTLASILKA